MADRAAADVSAKQGHDIFHFIGPTAAFEDDVIDHQEMVAAVESRVGKMNPLLERCTCPRSRRAGPSCTWRPSPSPTSCER
jgi:hypothetical protein